MNSQPACLVLSLLLGAATLHAAAPLPLDLPRPDGQPGQSRKPVKVYILAGQSNMVGMGDLRGARPQYSKIYLSADPAIIPGVTPIGRDERSRPIDVVAVERHGMYDARAGETAVALGTVSEDVPAMSGDQPLIVTAQIDVPVTGTYLVHAGYEESSHNVVTVDGREVYRKEVGGQPMLTKVTLEQGERYPIEIRYSKSGSAAFWLERVDMPGHGDLDTVTKRDKKFPYLVDDEGNWTARADVTYIDPRLFPKRDASSLSATSNNGKSIGPELGFGSVMGAYHDEQVLLIKTAMGNRSLNWDFRPPSSGATDRSGADQWEGLEYREIVKGVRDTLANIDKVVPGYAGQGYELAGFGWFQGHKDSGLTREEYEKHLVNLINDLRKEFNVPKMPAVVASVGFHGYRMASGPWQGVWEAQMAVGDPRQHPEWAGTVAAVDTRDFWREIEESPRSQDYHYHRNAETYLLIGEAMGRAMVRLQGGEAESIPVSDREARTAAAVAAEAAMTAPTAEQKTAHVVAIRPLILESALVAFINDPRNQSALQAALKEEKPAKKTPFLDNVLDEVVDFYQAAGIRDYDWQPFGGDWKNAAWDYFGFDLPGHPNRVNLAVGGEDDNEDDSDDAPAAKGKNQDPPAPRIVWPAGLENWFAPRFDTRKAGWRSGPSPFGESSEHLELPDWAVRRIPRRAPQTVIDQDVLLLRRKIDLPPLKEGYRYRIRVQGSAHNNMGESYAIYVNGQLLFENREGVLAWRKQGASPRGVPVYPEFRALFQGGEETLAVSSFAMENFDPDRFIPPGHALSAWIEEQKLPPLADIPVRQVLTTVFPL